MRQKAVWQKVCRARPLGFEHQQDILEYRGLPTLPAGANPGWIIMEEQPQINHTIVDLVSESRSESLQFEPMEKVNSAPPNFFDETIETCKSIVPVTPAEVLQTADSCVFVFMYARNTVTRYELGSPTLIPSRRCFRRLHFERQPAQRRSEGEHRRNPSRRRRTRHRRSPSTPPRPSESRRS